MLENDDKRIFKIITLGDSGVGKTSILKRFVTGKFEKNTLSIIGFESLTKEIELKNGTKITLQLIDTAGQENYHSLATRYIRNADGILFVFSHDNRDSFYNIKKWLDSFQDNNRDINFDKEFPAILVGNKCDLEHSIDDLEIQELKDDNNLYASANTSAKENIGIDRLFNRMGEMLFKNKGKGKKKQNMMQFKKHKKRKEINFASWFFNFRAIN